MNVKSVDEEPEVTLTRWGIMMENHGGYRLVGLRNGIGRVTSPIVEFDEHSRMARTASGRRYHLSGPYDEEVAARLIRSHIRHWGLTVRDVAMVETWEVSMFCGEKPDGPRGAN